jgi:dipeptidase E
MGVLELTALPTMDKDRWVPWVREADVLLVDGGEATYLAHWGWRTCCRSCTGRCGWA